MSEKNWSTDANFVIATTSSYLIMGRSVMIQLKNKMVSEAGWTVIGSSDGTQYEWAGDAAFPTVPDLVGTVDLTMTNMEFADLDADAPGGIASRSFLCDGVDEHVAASSSSAFDFDGTEPFSISCWFKTSSVTPSNYLVAKYYFNDAVALGYGLQLNNGALLGFLSSALVQGAVVTSTSTFNDDNWHHAVMTYGGAGVAASIKLFVDGQQVATTVGIDNLSGSTANSANFTVGGVSGDYDRSFEGRITEASVFEEALTVAQVEELYNEGVPTELSIASWPSLLGWWRADSVGTTGGVYTGDSTGAYDVWQDIYDVVRAVNGSGPGWAILQSPTTPSGTFYAVLAVEGPTDVDSNGFFAFADKRWLRHSTDPLLWLPEPAYGAATHGIERETFFLMYGATYTTRGYFSGAADGSFVYTTNLTDRAYFTGLIMFHVLDPNSVADNPLPTCSYVRSGDGGWSYGAYTDKFHGYHRRPELQDTVPVYFRSCYPVYDSTTRVFATMSTTDFEGNVEGYPLYLVAHDDINVPFAGRHTLLGRVPDLFAAPEGLSEGDIMPGGSPEWFVFGGWILPGDTAPVLGP